MNFLSFVPLSVSAHSGPSFQERATSPQAMSHMMTGEGRKRGQCGLGPSQALALPRGTRFNIQGPESPCPADAILDPGHQDPLPSLVTPHHPAHQPACTPFCRGDAPFFLSLLNPDTSPPRSPAQTPTSSSISISCHCDPHLPYLGPPLRHNPQEALQGHLHRLNQIYHMGPEHPWRTWTFPVQKALLSAQKVGTGCNH